MKKERSLKNLRKLLQETVKTTEDFVSFEHGPVVFYWIKEEDRGFIDVINPGKKHNKKELFAAFEEVMDYLPGNTIWELNPDTAQKQRIYEGRYANNSKYSSRIKINEHSLMPADRRGFLLINPYGVRDIPESIKKQKRGMWKKGEDIYFYIDPRTGKEVAGSAEGGLLFRVTSGGPKQGAKVKLVQYGSSPDRKAKALAQTAPEFLTPAGRKFFNESVANARKGGKQAHHIIPYDRAQALFEGATEAQAQATRFLFASLEEPVYFGDHPGNIKGHSILEHADIHGQYDELDEALKRVGSSTLVPEFNEFGEVIPNQRTPLSRDLTISNGAGTDPDRHLFNYDPDNPDDVAFAKRSKDWVNQQAAEAQMLADRPALRAASEASGGLKNALKRAGSVLPFVGAGLDTWDAIERYDEMMNNPNEGFTDWLDKTQFYIASATLGTSFLAEPANFALGMTNLGIDAMRTIFEKEKRDDFGDFMNNLRRGAGTTVRSALRF